ncbi:CHASE3 domain-containing protein [Polaromonas sp. C04]|uniref:CHASE3 domain-containing protein n=1 Tax=Polaromonas sp. C04 TaxID=1945857 RepID=UPI0009871EA4|nr:CHASE3 domain-containing protein [Polaromonas sp. C04]OOG58613.1 histidine kinase [Polaromonas sp. C04]
MRWFVMPKMTISLPLAVLAACLLIGINEAGYKRSAAAMQDMAQAQNIRTGLTTLLKLMLNAETGQRGFLLTGDPKYLAPYESALTEVNQNLGSLHELYASDPGELTEFNRLSQDVSGKMAEMAVSVRMRKQGQEDGWKAVLLTDVGKEQMDAIRDQTSKLIAQSARKMSVNQAQVVRALQLSRIGIALVAMIGLLAFYMYLLQSNALRAAGQREQESLKRERDQLERQVRERTESLAALATHLQQVREEERGHLARELHDELGSLLTAAKLDVARLKSRQAGASPEAAERLQHLTDTLNSGIALSRRIIEDLRPSSLSHLGLVASLEILAQEFGERAGLTVTTDLEAVELGGAAQLTVYRLLQESLTNIGKYAQAQQVTISLQNFDSYISVEVKDDGKGFDTTQARLSSHGLIGMRHRVEASGGRLTVTSRIGGGTCISAVLPKGANAG